MMQVSFHTLNWKEMCFKPKISDRIQIKSLNYMTNKLIINILIILSQNDSGFIFLVISETCKIHFIHHR